MFPMQVKKFWMIIPVNPEYNAVVRYDSREEATKHAEYCANKENIPYLILETVDLCNPLPKT